MTRIILQNSESNKVLRQKSRELTRDEILSQDIQDLILEMQDIMRKAPGVGLAAPQIGVSLQVAVIEDAVDRLQGIDNKILVDRQRQPVAFHVIINPKIISLSGKTKYFFEGCLSVNNCARVTPRKEIVQVKYLDENAIDREIIASGWYARILQHEIDHLNGRLYLDVSDARTEVSSDEYRSKWLNAAGEDVYKFHQDKLCDIDI